jgi:hypothetical protein
MMLFSCSGDESIIIEEPDIGYDYYPLLSQGDFREYQIELVFYSNQGKNKEIRNYFQLESVVESTGDQGNTASYRLDISKRNNENEGWEYSHSKIVEYNSLQAVEREFDERLVQLTFPIEVEKKWDGLVLMDATKPRMIAGESLLFYKDWEFKIMEKGLVEGNFDDLLTVQQANSENAVERRYSVEKYARGIGLVYKEQMILDTQCLEECQNMSWNEKAHKGWILSKKLIRYN